MGDTEDGERRFCVPRGTKSLSTSTLSGVRRSAVDESAHPQEALLKLHDKTWAGILRNQGPRISQEVDIVPGCAVLVACPSCSDYSSEPFGPGRIIGNMLAGHRWRRQKGLVCGCSVCWPLLAGVWRAIAPLMKSCCAEGEVPTAANLNLYRGWRSCVGWHRDDEPLFGERGEAKLIVSVSFGTPALFKWKGKSCPGNDGNSCCLGHGDILVMDGQCQDD